MQPIGELLLYATVVIVSVCGLVYELVAGAISNYLLGDSVTQLSTVIGVHLSAMGVGAWLSRYVEEEVARAFFDCQIASSLIGGLSAPILYVAFAETSQVRLVLYLLVGTTGVLVGAELPLLMRLLRRRVAFRDVVPRVLSLDYVGALLGSLLFALVFLPRLGFLRTGIVFGALGVVTAGWGTFLLGTATPPRPVRVRALIALGALGLALMGSGRLVRAADEALLQHPVVHTQQTDYQRIVLTQAKSGISLFLDGNLQFSSIDEYRYHEALVHPAMASAKRHDRVLVLGGGDGLAAREILKYPDVKSVTLIDLDPGMTNLARDLPFLRALNAGSLSDARVSVHNEDAMVWLAEKSVAPFDVAIVDFPDPNNFALGKLYTVRFYKLLRERLAGDAVISVQSTSPLVARRSFWCVVQTLEDAGFSVRPYHAFVPSFGEWGYALASPSALAVPSHLGSSLGLRYLTEPSLPAMFDFPPDMERVPVEANRLNNQILVRYYEEEWQRWMR